MISHWKHVDVIWYFPHTPSGAKFWTRHVTSRSQGLSQRTDPGNEVASKCIWHQAEVPWYFETKVWWRHFQFHQRYHGWWPCRILFFLKEDFQSHGNGQRQQRVYFTFHMGFQDQKYCILSKQVKFHILVYILKAT